MCDTKRKKEAKFFMALLNCNNLLNTMKSIILGVLFVATVAIAFPSQLTYNIGDEYDYTCSALVDSRGQMADGSRTSGSYSTLNGIVAVQVSLNNKLH
jgi:hypothetical protein